MFIKFTKKSIQFVLWLILLWLSSNQPAWASPLLEHVSLDHVVIVTPNLEQSVTDWESLGFTIKPGRTHANSIENAHIKFADGSAIELLTASKKVDDLSAWYVDFLARNPNGGGAFVALGVETAIEYERIFVELTERKLNPQKVNLGYVKLLTFPTESPLHPIFFLHYSLPPMDLRGHPNQVQGIVHVWLDENESGTLLPSLRSLTDSTRVKYNAHGQAIFQLKRGELGLTAEHTRQRISAVTLQPDDGAAFDRFVQDWAQYSTADLTDQPLVKLSGVFLTMEVDTTENNETLDPK